MNENYLEGLRCPRCGSWGPFTIETVTLMEWSDDGSEPCSDYESYWSDESPCYCKNCNKEGTIEKFSIAHQPIRIEKTGQSVTVDNSKGYQNSDNPSSYHSQ